MMRIKHRLILVESTIPVDEENRRRFETQIYAELLKQLGEINYHLSNPKILEFVGSNRFIIRCSLDGYRELIVGLSMIKSLNRNEIGLFTIKSSGTVRSLMRGSP